MIQAGAGKHHGVRGWSCEAGGRSQYLCGTRVGIRPGACQAWGNRLTVAPRDQCACAQAARWLLAAELQLLSNANVESSDPPSNIHMPSDPPRHRRSREEPRASLPTKSRTCGSWECEASFIAVAIDDPRPHARRARPHEHHETDEPVDREPAKDILGCSGPWQGRRKRRFLSPRPILHISSLTPELLPALIHRSTASGRASASVRPLVSPGRHHPCITGAASPQVMRRLLCTSHLCSGLRAPFKIRDAHM